MTDVNVFVITVLAAANVIQFIFWSVQTHRLIDKVMSGNYYSYQTAKGVNEKKEPQMVLSDAPVEDLSGVKSLYPF